MRAHPRDQLLSELEPVDRRDILHDHILDLLNKVMVLGALQEKQHLDLWVFEDSHLVR